MTTFVPFPPVDYHSTCRAVLDNVLRSSFKLPAYASEGCRCRHAKREDRVGRLCSSTSLSPDPTCFPSTFLIWSSCQITQPCAHGNSPRHGFYRSHPYSPAAPIQCPSRTASQRSNPQPSGLLRHQVSLIPPLEVSHLLLPSLPLPIPLGPLALSSLSYLTLSSTLHSPIGSLSRTSESLIRTSKKISPQSPRLPRCSTTYPSSHSGRRRSTCSIRITLRRPLVRYFALGRSASKSRHRSTRRWRICLVT